MGGMYQDDSCAYIIGNYEAIVTVFLGTRIIL